MNIKKIVFTTSLFIYCNLVVGASYDLSNEQKINSTNSELLLPLKNRSNNSLFNLYSPGQQDSTLKKQDSTLKKQDYLDVLGLLKKNQLEEAEIRIETLIILHPNEPTLYNLQALLETLKKNSDSAINSYQKAIALNQENLTAHLGLALIFLETGNFVKATEHANISLPIDYSSISYCIYDVIV